MAQYIYNILKDYSHVLDYLHDFNLGNEKIKELKVKGNILINGKIENIDSPLKKDDELILKTQEFQDLKPFKAFLDILYEDDNLLIINKPKGVAIHSDGALRQDNTLSNMVAHYYNKKNLDIPVRYVHRLDYDTTGIIIFAKDILTMSNLSYLLQTHSFKRDYLALVSGKVLNDEVIDLKIGRDRHVNGKYRVSPTSGKEAITYVHPLKVFPHYSLVRLSLKTGRTHQIRVHMSYKGHPLLGDTLYNGNTKYIKRQALHSYYVNFISKVTNKKIELYCDLPQDLSKLVQK